jgi:hypothetical protein
MEWRSRLDKTSVHRALTPGRSANAWILSAEKLDTNHLSYLIKYFGGLIGRRWADGMMWLF